MFQGAGLPELLAFPGLPGNPSSYPYLQGRFEGLSKAFRRSLDYFQRPSNPIKRPLKGLSKAFERRNLIEGLIRPLRALKGPYKALKGLMRPWRAL